jgi:hypothetical protein
MPRLPWMNFFFQNSQFFLSKIGHFNVGGFAKQLIKKGLKVTKYANILLTA